MPQPPSAALGQGASLRSLFTGGAGHQQPTHAHYQGKAPPGSSGHLGEGGGGHAGPPPMQRHQFYLQHQQQQSQCNSYPQHHHHQQRQYAQQPVPPQLQARTSGPSNHNSGTSGQQQHHQQLAFNGQGAASGGRQQEPAGNRSSCGALQQQQQQASGPTLFCTLELGQEGQLLVNMGYHDAVKAALKRWVLAGVSERVRVLAGCCSVVCLHLCCVSAAWEHSTRLQHCRIPGGNWDAKLRAWTFPIAAHDRSGGRLCCLGCIPGAGPSCAAGSLNACLLHTSSFVRYSSSHAAAPHCCTRVVEVLRSVKGVRVDVTQLDPLPVKVLAAANQNPGGWGRGLVFWVVEVLAAANHQ